MADHWVGWIPPDIDSGEYLIIDFGSSCKPLAQLTCDDVHRGSIPKGDHRCCMAEHCPHGVKSNHSGIDHFGSMQPSAEDPKPEPLVVMEAESEPTRAEERTGKPTSGKMARRKKARKARELADAA